MAQIIKHRRGSLEGLSAVTSSVQKGELLIATGSSNLTTVNGASLVFAAAADGQIQAVNRFLQGNSAPNTFSNASYNGLVNGVPYYDSGSGTLYLLGSDANTAISLIGNIQSFSQSVDSRLDTIETSIGGGGSLGSRVATLETSSANLNSFSSSQLEKDSNSNLSYYQSNVEGELINFIQGFDGDGIILNAGGYTHTSVALRDCINSDNLPKHRAKYGAIILIRNQRFNWGSSLTNDEFPY